MIVIDNNGQYFRVTDAGPGLDHVFLGVPVKRVRGGFADKAGARARLIRRLGCTVVEG